MAIFRWLADDEDDGAVIREVFADSEAALLRSMSSFAFHDSLYRKMYIRVIRRY